MGRLTGKLRRGQPLPQHSRLHATAAAGPAIDDARLFDIVEALDAIAAETGRSVPQIAINWLLQRPTVSTVLIGARDEVQLRENLGAVGWSLTGDQRARLDQVSAVEPPYPYYPYWRGQFAERSPLPLWAGCANAPRCDQCSSVARVAAAVLEQPRHNGRAAGTITSGLIAPTPWLPCSWRQLSNAVIAES